ncbi:MAG: ABC transporter substrate-binding protein [Thermoanaerobaculia bacterium]|nr:ABC transporter substrate-binding protein [Thermoanaerobaculia bacterium]MCZ7652386.1 ABC transporter substrate-binding protein [Thermoanaerobaculia bacterium]
MNRTRRLLLPLALGLALLGCPGSDKVKVGVVLPLTGSAEVYGQAIRRGIEVAEQRATANAESPYVIEILWRDSKSDPETAKRLLDSVYDEGAIVAIGGVTSAEALAMVPVADDASRVLLSPSASQPQLSGISSNFYRVFPSDASEGTMMANFARQTLSLSKVVVLAKEETYAKGAQEVFRERFTELGGQVVEVLVFPPNTVDFSGLVERVGTVAPDAVYVAAYAGEIVNLVKALRSDGFAGAILTTSSFSTADAIRQAGPAAEGVYFTQTAFAPSEKNPEVTAFVAAYKAKYRSEPDLYAAHGYDAYRVLLAAMRESGKSGSDFWKGMRGVNEFPGVTGTFQFDEKGDVKKFPRVFMVREGQALDLEKEEEARREEIRKKMREIQEELLRLRAQGGGD